ncbi:hypothetical protein B5T_01244 [Alloalcanivorax dieselolei B5]|uniref:Uncharacterized protein n=1 Tax=Alcanivorax dieselolei (strain DSM 16502 / CGMCC 1.3690 / MCCC 1A00001 / B-5) TaxID=930169 RepID=K0CCV7_ALCDB|nr:hypothetical protein B5T_01244 [Alloalcanivorax dieselolei B5]
MSSQCYTREFKDEAVLEVDLWWLRWREVWLALIFGRNQLLESD